MQPVGQVLPTALTIGRHATGLAAGLAASAAAGQDMTRQEKRSAVSSWMQGTGPVKIEDNC